MYFNWCSKTCLPSIANADITWFMNLYNLKFSGYSRNKIWSTYPIRYYFTVYSNNLKYYEQILIIIVFLFIIILILIIDQKRSPEIAYHCSNVEQNTTTLTRFRTCQRTRLLMATNDHHSEICGRKTLTGSSCLPTFSLWVFARVPLAVVIFYRSPTVHFSRFERLALRRLS